MDASQIRGARSKEIDDVRQCQIRCLDDLFPFTREVLLEGCAVELWGLQEKPRLVPFTHSRRKVRRLMEPPFQLCNVVFRLTEKFVVGVVRFGGLAQHEVPPLSELLRQTRSQPPATEASKT